MANRSATYRFLLQANFPAALCLLLGIMAWLSSLYSERTLSAPYLEYCLTLSRPESGPAGAWNYKLVLVNLSESHAFDELLVTLTIPQDRAETFLESKPRVQVGAASTWGRYSRTDHQLTFQVSLQPQDRINITGEISGLVTVVEGFVPNSGSAVNAEQCGLKTTIIRNVEGVILITMLICFLAICYYAYLLYFRKISLPEPSGGGDRGGGADAQEGKSDSGGTT